jgi:hypothetical protein
MLIGVNSESVTFGIVTTLTFYEHSSHLPPPAEMGRLGIRQCGCLRRLITAHSGPAWAEAVARARVSYCNGAILEPTPPCLTSVQGSTRSIVRRCSPLMGMSRFLLKIVKRSLPRFMLSGVGLASKDAV